MPPGNSLALHRLFRIAVAQKKLEICPLPTYSRFFAGKFQIWDLSLLHACLLAAPAGMQRFLCAFFKSKPAAQKLFPKGPQHDASSSSSSGDAVKLAGASSYRTQLPPSILPFPASGAFYGFILSELLGAQSPAALNIRIKFLGANILVL